MLSSRFAKCCAVLLLATAWQAATVRADPAGIAPGLDTRVIPKTVYDLRYNTTGFRVPPGYRPAWRDDRLNPRRAEGRLVRAARPGEVTVPPGYMLSWDPDRLNAARGPRSAAGTLATNRIWTEQVPRRLRPAPPPAHVVAVPVVRVSTRSARARATGLREGR
jgi:hypothetical protein